MSRFAALDLTALPEPGAIGVLDYDAILEARLVGLEARLSGIFAPPKVTEIMGLARNIASSPMRYLNEAAAARELYLENRINAAIRSVFLSTARGRIWIRSGPIVVWFERCWMPVTRIIR